MEDLQAIEESETTMIILGSINKEKTI